MDIIYETIEVLHIFIPILALVVVGGTLYFCSKSEPERDVLDYDVVNSDPDEIEDYDDDDKKED